MEVGYGLITCQRHPADPRSDVALYAEALALAEAAERTGFDSVWVSEHHFLDDAYMPSLLPVCAAIAARTQRVRIGTGVLLAPLIHPLRLAEDAATVDLLSGGRLVLGLGLGWRAEELDAFGVASRDRVRLTEEAVAVLRAAWGDGLARGVPVTPKPARRGGPPIWLGAMVEPALRRAGRIADGLMATEVTPESFGEQVKWAREAAAQAGRDPDALALSLHLPTFAWPGEDRWARVRDFHWHVAWKYEDMEHARGRTGPPASAPPFPADREAELRAGIVLGTPEQVAEQLHAFGEAAGGPLHYVARLYWPGMDPGVRREALHVFADGVLPLVR